MQTIQFFMEILNVQKQNILNHNVIYTSDICSKLYLPLSLWKLYL